ncbi:hypothetical protein LK996_15630 [Lysobacter sp. A6]|uniref:Uncharacterized protein n=1 Tax=Noviluteimonas lactosilytica TaxID=2888523 RepID=A0ABS8JLL0_9GAMM|nr:hypothetical protein [Lysobacter lactosilyticus]MCC8364502.1 hypothetical protein [Lysobacter lactosilyticus]
MDARQYGVYFRRTGMTALESRSTLGLQGQCMMTNREFVDVHVDDLRDKLPSMLHQFPRAIAFLKAFNERAEPIVEAATMLSDEDGAYAKQRLAEVLIAFGRETGLRSV